MSISEKMSYGEIAYAKPNRAPDSKPVDRQRYGPGILWIASFARKRTSTRVQYMTHRLHPEGSAPAANLSVRPCSRRPRRSRPTTAGIPGVGFKRFLRYRKRKWTSPAVQKVPAWDRRPAGRPSSPGRQPQVTRRLRGPTRHRQGLPDWAPGGHRVSRLSSPRP